MRERGSVYSDVKVTQCIPIWQATTPVLALALTSEEAGNEIGDSLSCLTMYFFELHTLDWMHERRLAKLCVSNTTTACAV